MITQIKKNTNEFEKYFNKSTTLMEHKQRQILFNENPQSLNKCNRCGHQKPKILATTTNLANAKNFSSRQKF